jgi:dihydrofolate reductase
MRKMKTPTRKIIAYLATSADGYIARRDGGVDWLNRPRPAGNYGMAAFLRSIDTILWGRKTYDEALARGYRDLGFGPRMRHYIFTHRPPQAAAPGVEFVTEPVKAFAQRLRAEPGKDIWMMGGAGLIGSFLDAGEIDELSIHVVPILLGEGIPLVSPLRKDVRLRLIGARPFPDGVVHLNYRVADRG